MRPEESVVKKQKSVSSSVSVSVSNGIDFFLAGEIYGVAYRFFIVTFSFTEMLFS